MKHNVIGILGFIGSGKGTLGDHLQTNHGYTSMSFARTLKDAVSSIFGWPRYLLEGDTRESREWREVPDEYWSEKIGRPITPRWVLQNIGTDVLRTHFHNNIWIWSLEKQVLDATTPVVITDVRFPNEVKMIEDLGGKLIWVRRNPEPEWFDMAVNQREQMRLMRKDVHPTEYEWLGAGDYIQIWNDSTLETFYQRIDQAIK